MKRWKRYVLIVACLSLGKISPFSGTDAAKLAPVVLIQITRQNGQYRIDTDTGDWGLGDTPKAALQDLKDTTSGTIFLQTADFLLLAPDCIEAAKQLYGDIRPACGVCLINDRLQLINAPAFLKSHRPPTSLHGLCTGETKLPILVEKEGRLTLLE